VEGVGLVVGVVPVTGHLDLKALAQAVGGKKAVMATPEQAQRSSGYTVGGISPIGQRKPLPTVVDSSATTYDKIYVSGGRRGFDLGLAPADLLAITQATLAPIAAPD
jgi:Cys-tRNA(Pro)/Cys-tRNA(Cys) deacylase